MARPAAAVALLLLLTACTSTLPPDASTGPPTPVMSVMAEPNPPAPTSSGGVAPDEVVLLRANTNLWTTDEERTVTVPANVVLFGDGLLIADVSPVGDRQQWRAVKLGPSELDDVLDAITAANPHPFQLETGACADCGMQVIQARARNGELVEMAVDGLYTNVGEDYIPPGTPGSMVQLSRLLDDLQALAERRPEVPTARQVPQIPAGQLIGG